MSNNEAEKIVIKGGKPLYGTVKIQGSKNTVLPIMAASLLVKGRTVLHNCPDITDVTCMKVLLETIGCTIVTCKDSIAIYANELSEYNFSGEYVEKMRSSIILLGAMLSRVGEAKLPGPGGCTIGKRPIDYHLDALEKLGATFEIQNGTIHGQCIEKKGNVIQFPKVSVGATENAILLAVMAKGDSYLLNASIEPEVLELCEFLKYAGAKIFISIEERLIYIRGVRELSQIEYTVSPDRIIAGTYCFACLVCQGRIFLEDAPIKYMQSTFSVIKQMGAQVDVLYEDNTKCAKLSIEMEQRAKAIPNLETAVYPGFPTDLQSVALVAACIAIGESRISENIFENRFQIVPMLTGMGANIILGKQEQRQYVAVLGVEKLQGTQVVASELRGGAALVLAGLCAKGVTEVSGVQFIDRGHENLERDLSMLGAEICRVKGMHKQ